MPAVVRQQVVGGGGGVIQYLFTLVCSASVGGRDSRYYAWDVGRQVA